MKRLLLLVFLLPTPAWCQAFSTMPYVFVNGQTYNPSQLQSDFQAIVNQGNSIGTLLNSQISAVTPAPSGTMLFFHLASCPSGWTDVNGGGSYTGLFVRGLDSGRGQDTTGTVVGGTEATQMQDHTHSFSAMTSVATTVHISSGGSGIISFLTTANTGSGHNTGAVSGATAGATVLAKNVALLLCSKN